MSKSLKTVAINGPIAAASPPKIITVRVSADFKRRVDDAAYFQRLSMNQFCVNAIADATAKALEAQRGG